MPSDQLSRLADDLWLAAHDGADGRPCVGERPLAVGLATALLAELVQGGFVELREGELFRTKDGLPGDSALSPVLSTMAAEERDWARARVHQGREWSPLAGDGLEWPPRAGDRQGWPDLVQGEDRHRLRGHDLGVWMSYLAYERRAERLVVDRLLRAGLVRRREERRLLQGRIVRYVPYDAAVSGNPANRISTAVRLGYVLNDQELMLAGLFLATGLHEHALETVTRDERSALTGQLGRRLDAISRELLSAADVAIGEAAMR